MFTGSTRVGRLVAEAAGRNLTPVTLELGGKSPAIVDRSADLDQAAERIAYGKLLNAGQTCIAPDYALVPESSVQDFAERLQGQMRRMFGTDPANEDYTSIVSDRHYARLEGLVADAARQGRNDHAGGKARRSRVESDNANSRRRIIVGATPEMAVMQEEIFGPLLPVIGYRDAAEPIAYINAHDRPLALYWFGKDNAARDEVLARTVSGGVTVNDCLFHFAQINQPMGGVGASGTGAYHGEWGFRTLTQAEAGILSLAVQPARRSLSALWREDRAAGEADAVDVVDDYDRHCEERGERSNPVFARGASWIASLALAMTRRK